MKRIITAVAVSLTIAAGLAPTAFARSSWSAPTTITQS